MEGRPGSLADLMLMAMELHGTTFNSKLVEIAREGGHEVSDQTLGKLTKGRYGHKPGRKLLSAVAFLAGVSYEVAEAAARGMTETLPPFVDQLPPDVNILDQDRRDLVVAVVVALIKAQELDDQLAGRVVSDVSYLTEADLEVPDVFGEAEDGDDARTSDSTNG